VADALPRCEECGDPLNADEPGSYCVRCEPCSVCGAINCTSRRCAYNDEDRDE
jgi:hypothetical protein